MFDGNFKRKKQIDLGRRDKGLEKQRENPEK
jgi:hypothetical protein